MMIKKMLLMLVLISVCVSASDHWKISYTSGDVTINTSRITGSGIGCADVLDASYDVCAGGGAGSSYTNSSPISLTGTVFGLSPCPDTYVLTSNTTYGGYQCQPRVSGTGGGTVTSAAGDGTYVTGTITTSGTFGFNEANLNTTIDARDSDTLYTAGNGLTLSTTTFNINAITAAAGQYSYWDGNSWEVRADQDSWVSDKTAINSSIVSNTALINTKVNKSGDNMTGVFRFIDSTVRLDNETNMFFYDTGDEAKHLNSFAENYDKLRVNTYVHPIDSFIFSNGTGTYVTLNTTSGQDITVILSDGVNSNVLSFNYNSTTLKLTGGTDTIPLLNYIYAKDIAGTPTWYVSDTEPTGKYATVSTILLGSSDNVYGTDLKEDISDGSIKKIQQTFKKKGLLYDSGFDYNATATDVSVTSGDFIGGISPASLICNVDTSDFYLVDSDNLYQTYTDIDDIPEYSNGELISTNKYFIVVLGIIPNNDDCRLYAAVQTLNKGEYGKLDDAVIDKDNDIVTGPADSFLAVNFLPVVKIIVKKGTGIQQLSNDLYGVDFRGNVAQSGSSGGGVSETDPLAIHFDGSIPLTSNWDAGDFNITADTFIGDIDCSNITGSTSDLCTIANTNNYVTGLAFTGTTTKTLTLTRLGLSDISNTFTDTDTTYTASNGISLSSTIFSVNGNTALTQDIDGLSVTNDAIGDTQLAYNTGQHLTVTSDVKFNEVNITDVVRFGDSCLYSNGTALIGEATCTV